jgi:hypothetical protein
MGIPAYTRAEGLAVQERTIQNFVIAVGGAVSMERISGEVGAEGSAEAYVNSALSVLRYSSTQVAAMFRFKKLDTGSSMSVLVPGQSPFTTRTCTGQEFYNLVDWFAYIELMAWSRVRAYFDSMPPSIFLVYGQTLSPGYAITHKETASSECCVLLSASADILKKLKVEAVGEYKVEHAKAAYGFDEVKEEAKHDLATGEVQDPQRYTIFMNVRVSSYSRQIKKGELKIRIDANYR